MSDTLIGLTGKDFVLVAADTAAARSIVVFKNDEDKILELDSHKLLASSGPPGDRVAFTEYIDRNVELYALQNDIQLSTKAAANFTR